MKPRTLLALLAVTVILGGFIFFFEKDLPSTDERREQAKKVLRLEVAEIHGLVIENGDGTLRFERREEPSSEDGEVDLEDSLRPVTWYLTEPLEARADGIALADLLKDLVGLESGQRLESVDAAAAGLDEPVVKATLETSEGVQTLLFGEVIPASDDRIVAIEGEPGGHVAPASVVFELRRSANAWRDKSLVSALRSDVQQVAITTGEQRWVLEARDETFWMTEPIVDLADEDRVSSFFGAVLGLRAESFVETSPLTDDGLGLEPPRIRLEVSLKDQEEGVTIDLGGPPTDAMSAPDGEEMRYARVDGELVTVRPGTLLELPTSTAADWQSRAWSGLEVFQVERAEIESTAGPSMILAREGSDWSRDGEIIDYTAVSDLLYAIAESRALEVLEPEAAADRNYVLGATDVTVRLSSLDANEELRLLDEVDGLHAVTVSGRDKVLLMEAETISELRRLIDVASKAGPPEEAIP